MKRFFKHIKRFVLLIWILSAILSCTQKNTAPLDRLPDNKAGEIVKKAIEFAGGWETWESKKTVSYRKTSISFDEDGNIKNERLQLHQYILHPDMRVRIEWESEGKKHVLINDKYFAYRFVDGKEITETKLVNSARNATYGSHYVFCMPFKLTDPGTKLTYSGQEQLDNGILVDKVRTEYEPGTGDAAGLHIWTYYFDASDGRLRANLLEFDSGHYLFTEYVDHRMIDGIHMPTRRYGYKSNESGEKLFKSSEIFYEDVQFNAALPDSLFAVSKKTGKS